MAFAQPDLTLVLNCFILLSVFAILVWLCLSLFYDVNIFRRKVGFPRRLLNDENKPNFLSKPLNFTFRVCNVSVAVFEFIL